MSDETYSAENDAAIAAAEQRGREDNAEHSMCYVHGSKALEALLAQVWDEGWCAGRARGAGGGKPRGDNPYRPIPPGASAPTEWKGGDQ